MLIKVSLSIISIVLAFNYSYSRYNEIKQTVMLYEEVFRFAKAAKQHLLSPCSPITTLLPAQLTNGTPPLIFSHEYQDCIREYLQAYETLPSDKLISQSEAFIKITEEELLKASKKAEKDIHINLCVPPLCALLFSLAII